MEYYLGPYGTTGEDIVPFCNSSSVSPGTHFLFFSALLRDLLSKNRLRREKYSKAIHTPPPTHTPRCFFVFCDVLALF
jgi:hypothetical protein